MASTRDELAELEAMVDAILKAPKLKENETRGRLLEIWGKIRRLKQQLGG